MEEERLTELERQLKLEQRERHKLIQENQKLLCQNGELQRKNQEIKKVLREIREELRIYKLELHKVKAEFRKHHNENSPSGSIPPFLKPEAEDKEPKERQTPDQTTPNPRNSREEPDQKITLDLKCCPNCGGKVCKMKCTPRMRRVKKLNMPSAVDAEYESPRYYCGACEKEVSPRVPDALPNCKFDLQFLLLFSFLNVGLNMTDRNISNLFKTVFGVRVCPASVSNGLKRLREYLGPAYSQIEEEIKKAVAVYRDETSARKNGKLQWIWVATTLRHAFYRIQRRRDKKAAAKMPQNPGGASVADGYRVYKDGIIQRCWAHSGRKGREPKHWFHSYSERRSYIKLARRLKELLRAAKRDKRKKGVSAALRKRYDGKLLRILQEVKVLGKNANDLINYYMQYNDEWFVFLEFEEVEPTNNRAERALRHLVVKRKVSQQFRGNEAMESYAMQASIFMSSRLQGTEYVDVLRHAVEGELHDAVKS
jgi:transposase